MFEIGWSELLVIGVVLIVVVGPKDLPRMLRTFGRTTTHLRKMAGDFRKQFDDALREAELDDVRDTVKDLRSLDPRQEIRKALSPMRAVGDEIRSSLMAATKAPESKVPSATESAVAAEASSIGTTQMEPLAGAVAAADTTTAVTAPSHSSSPSSAEASTLNGSGPHDGGKVAAGGSQ